MKVAIIGGSIAGGAAANLLAKHATITVYDKHARKDIGKKLCANVVTPSYISHIKKLGIAPQKFIVSRLNDAYLFSPNNRAHMKTREYKIDRNKIIGLMIKKAIANKVKFSFNTEFLDFSREKGKYLLKLRKGSRIIKDSCDILIGADGALSKVAEKAGLLDKKALWLVMQTEVPLKKLKKYGINKSSYYLYLGKRKYGFYTYIFSTKNKAVIGIGDRPEQVKEKYHAFMKELGIRKSKIGAALIPEPKNTPWKKGLFLIGDAGGFVKFNGGGFVPAIASAEAAKEIIINKNYKLLRTLRFRNTFNRLVAKAVYNSKDKDLDNLLETFKDKKFSDLLIKRDEFSLQDYLKITDMRFLRFIFKVV